MVKALLIIIMGILLVRSVIAESVVYDESWQIYVAQKIYKDRDFSVEPINPPLSREIIGFPQLFDKNVTSDPVLFWPRMMVVFATLILGIIVFSFAKNLYGPGAGVFALLLYVFDPNILTHGHYANTDLLFTLGFVLTIYLFFRFSHNLTLKRVVILSFILGLDFALKLSTLFFIIPSLVLINRSKTRVKFLIVGIFVCLVTLWSTYLFTYDSALGSIRNVNRRAVTLAQISPLVNFALNQPLPLGGYLTTIKADLIYSQTDAYSKKAFLMGEISKSGFWYFFPVAILLKTPLPLIVLFIWALLAFRQTKNKRYTLIPILFTIIPACFAGLNIGIRHILPIFPFAIIFSSQLANKLNIVKVILVCWLIARTLSFSPHYISFFNELIGNRDNGYKYLVDSNLDWGQGLIALARYQKENNIPALNLSYFGMADPHKYGIKTSSQSKIYAISATNYWYENFYKNPKLFGVKPDKIVGGSILIFH